MDSFSLLWDCNVNKGKLNRNVLAILQCSCVTFTCFWVSAWGCFCISSYVDTFLITGAFNTWIERQAQQDCTCKKWKQHERDVQMLIMLRVLLEIPDEHKYTKTPFILCGNVKHLTSHRGASWKTILSFLPSCCVVKPSASFLSNSSPMFITQCKSRASKYRF